MANPALPYIFYFSVILSEIAAKVYYIKMVPRKLRQKRHVLRHITDPIGVALIALIFLFNPESEVANVYFPIMIFTIGGMVIYMTYDDIKDLLDEIEKSKPTVENTEDNELNIDIHISDSD